MDKFGPTDYHAKPLRARAATLSEMEDLLIDCYDAAHKDSTAGWEVFDLVKTFVFDHTIYIGEKI